MWKRSDPVVAIGAGRCGVGRDNGAPAQWTPAWYAGTRARVEATARRDEDGRLHGNMRR